MPDPASPLADLTAVVLTLSGEAATAELGANIASHSGPGDVIACWGDLGAGKTVFARGFVQSLTTAEEEVPSPTFTLVQTYDADKAPIYHFDLYRLEHPNDAWELGIEEAFSDGITLIEWPDRLRPYLPATCLNVILEHDKGDPTLRIARLDGHAWQDRLSQVANNGETDA